MIWILLIVFVLISFLVSMSRLLFIFSQLEFLTTEDFDKEARVIFFVYIVAFVLLILIVYFWR